MGAHRAFSHNQSFNDEKFIEQKKEAEMVANATHHQAIAHQSHMLLSQHYQVLQEQKKEFDDNIKKKFLDQEKVLYETSLKNYDAKQEALSKKIAQENVAAFLYKQAQELLKHFLHKIEYLKGFIQSLTKEIVKINEEIKSSKEAIISQYTASIKKTYPAKIAEDIINHLQEKIYKPFLQGEVTAAQLDKNYKQEMRSIEFQKKIIESNLNIDAQRFQKATARLISSTENNEGLQKTIKSHDTDLEKRDIFLKQAHAVQAQLREAEAACQAAINLAQGNKPPELASIQTHPVSQQGQEVSSSDDIERLLNSSKQLLDQTPNSDVAIQERESANTQDILNSLISSQPNLSENSPPNAELPADDIESLLNSTGQLLDKISDDNAATITTTKTLLDESEKLTHSETSAPSPQPNITNNQETSTEEQQPEAPSIRAHR